MLKEKKFGGKDDYKQRISRFKCWESLAHPRGKYFGISNVSFSYIFMCVDNMKPWPKVLKERKFDCVAYDRTWFSLSEKLFKKVFWEHINPWYNEKSNDKSGSSINREKNCVL